MSACEQLTADASLGAAPALRAVDCLANEAAASAFGRLFAGADGSGGGTLLPALTLALTLYIAFFAISLLTGRSRLGISALTPRMLTLGLVLTFATSWVAYQSVVWNLAIGAPDQLAGVLLGAPGASGGASATVLFADRLDIVFAAIARAGELAGGGQDAAQGAAQGGSFTPPNLMWLGALLLLLGTVGVLVTARIALAVLLALGPVFVVFALFSGTRGLFAGWLRGVVMTAITPLFVVLGGGLILELLVPVLANLVTENGISGQAAMALFLIASVHVALMAMVLKVTGAIVSGWQVFGAGSERDAQRSMTEMAAQMASGPAIAGMAAQAQQTGAPTLSRSAAFASTTGASALASEAAPGASSSPRHSRGAIAPASGGGAPVLPPLARQRARGIGSRFAARPSQSREMLR